MIHKLELEIPLLLPDVTDEQDGCVARLQEILLTRRGVDEAHVIHENGSALLCLHYDPALLTLVEVRRAAEQAGAQLTDRFRHESLSIEDMDCGDCALVVEHSLGRLDGVLSVRVNYAAGRAWVEYDTSVLRRKTILRRIKQLGYRVIEDKGATWWQRHWELILTALGGGFLLVGWVGETFFGMPQPVATGFLVLSYIAGGYSVGRHALPALSRLHFDTDVLMLFAAIGAAILGEWAEGAFLLFLFGLGHAGEHYAMDRARQAIQALADLSPTIARVRRDGRAMEVPVVDLHLGDVVLVRDGERIPADGYVIAGHSAVDQSPITGESLPIDKALGDQVFAGTINGNSFLEIEVARRAEDTTLSRVIQMVAEAQSQKSPTQRLTERFARVFVPAVLALAGVAIVVPPLLGWSEWGDSFSRGLVLLVAASPCALVIGTPASVLAGIAQAARNGVLIKGGVHLENLGALNALAFDKTGTITRGRPEVTDVIVGDGQPNSTDHLLSLAAAVESRSGHPLAQAVVRAAEARGLALPQAGDLEAVGGRGVFFEVFDGRGGFFEASDHAEGFHGGSLLGGLLAGSPGAGVPPTPDHDGYLERLGVVGAFLVQEVVNGRGAQVVLGVLLEQGLVVELMFAGHDAVDLLVHVSEDESPGLLQAAVQIHRPDNGLVRAGRQARRHARRLHDAFAEVEMLDEVEPFRHAGARLAADDNALDARQFAFQKLGEPAEQFFADDEAQNGVAEEFEPLVRLQAVRGHARVRQRALEQVGAVEPVLQDRLDGLERVGVAHRARAPSGGRGLNPAARCAPF